jgi:hypothetical protein
MCYFILIQDTNSHFHSNLKATLLQSYLSVFLNKPAWDAKSTRKDVMESITTNPITPAHIMAGDGLWKIHIYDAKFREIRGICEPAVPILR